VTLARLAALHARSEFAQGHLESGAEEASAILTLARRGGSDPIAISILVRYLIEEIAIELLATSLLELHAQAPEIISAYDALPVGATFQRAYLTMEKQHTVEWLIRKLREAEARKKGSWREVWKQATDRPGESDVIQRVDSVDQAVKLTEALLPVCDEMATLIALPREEFAARYPAFKEKTKANHPLAGYLLTTPETVRARQDRNQARMAMLRGAIAVVRGGPEALKELKDPFGYGPFAYRPLEKGFELRSKLLYHNQPVTLTVGPGTK
jgi:hypothetical protein